MIIHVETDGGTEKITVIGDQQAEDALIAHGYDPETVEYRIEGE